MGESSSSAPTETFPAGILLSGSPETQEAQELLPSFTVVNLRAMVWALQVEDRNELSLRVLTGHVTLDTSSRRFLSPTSVLHLQNGLRSISSKSIHPYKTAHEELQQHHSQQPAQGQSHVYQVISGWTPPILSALLCLSPPFSVLMARLSTFLLISFNLFSRPSLLSPLLSLK